MVDHCKKVAHTYPMLTTKESGAKLPQGQKTSLDADLKFISENQRIEGFSGDISEAVKQHSPDMNELVAVSKKFGAQIPQTPPPSKN